MHDKTFLAEMGERLRADAERLLVRDKALQHHLRGQDGRLDADFGDLPNFTGNDEVIEALDGEARRELALIRGALNRLEGGSYGICARCAEDIPVARLRARPAAALCVSCAQETAERR
jgi:RNA polymerase-binding transcription factor DksA